MANQEHLDILKQGVEAWNKWRKERPEIRPDLGGEDLTSANLIGADLRGANLISVNLSRQNLIRVNLIGADLSGADLSGADLSRVDLNGADLGRAILSEQNLSNTNLSDANLSRANLRDANLSDANLRDAILSGAFLSGTDLSRVNLGGQYLSRANLSGANLSGAGLSEANLSYADLSHANLVAASLQAARLIDTNLDGANLTDTHLWETQRAGWSIKGVVCESVYWDKEGKEKTAYAPGEFERLFADNLKIKLFYKGGMTPLEIITLPGLINYLEDAHQGCRLNFQSVENTAGGAILTLTLEASEDMSAVNLEAMKLAIQADAERDAKLLRQTLENRERDIAQLKGYATGLEWTVRGYSPGT